MSESQSISGSINMGGMIDESSSPEECNQNGNKALAAGDHTSAVQWYTAGLHRDAPIDLHHVLLSNRSSAYAHLCDWRRALNDADTCVQLQPQWPRGHACRGAALEGLGRQKEALQSFKEAQRLDPTNPELSEIVSEIEDSLSKSPEVPMPQYGAPVRNVQASEVLPTAVPSPPQAETRTMPLREVNSQANAYTPTLALDTSKLNASVNNSQYGSRRGSELANRQAGVGMHIVADDSHPGAAARVLLMALAPWSPLQGQAQIGDIIVAIDGMKADTLSFEKISQLILGPVSSPITISFVRPTAYPLKEWDVTVDRVFPSDVSTAPSPAPQVRAAPVQQFAMRAAAPPPDLRDGPSIDTSPPRDLSMLRSPEQKQYRAQMESVLSAIPVFMTLTLDEDYDKVTSSANTVQYFKNKLRIDLASALQVAPARFVIGGLAPGSVMAGLKILPSTSGGGGVPGVEPLTPAEIAADLKAQSVDLRSPLRQAVPNLTHASVADTPLGNSAPAPPGTPGTVAATAAEQADILRNFSEELQLLALFCKAPASEANLSSFSKQGSKLKPKHVLRTYQAVHELKVELAKHQEEAGRLHAELSSTTKGLMLDAERAKANEEAERLQKGLEIRDRAITTYKDELTSVKQQLAMMEKQKADLDDKVKRQQELAVKQEDQIASLRRGVMPSDIEPEKRADPQLESKLRAMDAEISAKSQENSRLARELADAKEKLSKPLPSIALTNGNVYDKGQLKTMVPNYEWDTFFTELLKIKPKADAEHAQARAASPQQSRDPVPNVSPTQTNVPLEPGEPPLPDGWSKDIYEGKPLYVNHSTRSFSWVHPAKVAEQGGTVSQGTHPGESGMVPSSSLQK